MLNLQREETGFRRDVDIILSQKFRVKIRKALFQSGIVKKGMIEEEIKEALRDYVEYRLLQLRKKLEKYKREIRKEETKLKKQLKEQLSVNEHIRQIYKRDLKRELRGWKWLIQKVFMNKKHSMDL